ncbi:MAG: coproporphyrinogen III oxidase family protein [Deltaproteobacteria bacterium]|nr:coproporphyrinogen III oxidase family protein [Deltaproteobacteria bacterium]
MSNGESPGLYIHVPFCRTKCPYCDFYSVTSLSLIPDWLDGLRKEAVFYKDHFAAFDSIYLGGGTPTLLAEHELAALMDCLFNNFTFSPDTEITIEANPDDITLDKLGVLRGIGVNRISFGVQSFDDKELQYLRRSGFEGQTEAGWVQTIKRALDFRPEHLSCYQMTLEEGTPFGKMLAQGRMKLLGEEEEREFFLLTSRLLEKEGYIHYEISNFAMGKEYISRHNSKYWRHVPYLGLGPAAHSFREDVRWWNLGSIESYCKALVYGKLPVAGSETLSEEQHRLESLYLGFRTSAGVDLELVRNQPRFDMILSELQESGLVQVHMGRAIPTREGFLVADSLPLLFADW